MTLNQNVSLNPNELLDYLKIGQLLKSVVKE